MRAILDEVREAATTPCSSLTERFDQRRARRPSELRVDAGRDRGAVGVLEPEVLAGLRTAIANVRAVARRSCASRSRSSCRRASAWRSPSVPVRRAAAYVPGGRAPYPSTVVMCAVTARAAGVDELAVCAPPGPGGRAHPVILAACALCGVTEVYRMGGAQAIARAGLRHRVGARRWT